MPLKRSVGNMYPWVTHTHCHLGGECPHKCSYCYVNSFPFGRPEKYKGPLRLIEKEFDVQYGTGKTIFIENCNDLFATGVSFEMIMGVIGHCEKCYPETGWVALSRLLDDKKLVEVFSDPISRHDSGIAKTDVTC